MASGDAERHVGRCHGLDAVTTPDVAPGDAERQTVYDLQGRKVETGSQNWENLPKGVYIVNGRKVVVR